LTVVAGASAKNKPVKKEKTMGVGFRVRSRRRPRTFSAIISRRNYDVNALSNEGVDEDLRRSDPEPADAATNRHRDDVAAFIGGPQERLENLRAGFP
jgi:hypothetical protein